MAKKFSKSTGDDDRLRMCALLAQVNCKPTKTGLSFTWEGSWEWDPISGTGSVQLLKDGTLSGRFRMEGDESTFIAKKPKPPKKSIPLPPSTKIKGHVDSRPISKNSPSYFEMLEKVWPELRWPRWPTQIHGPEYEEADGRSEPVKSVLSFEKIYWRRKIWSESETITF